MQASLRLLIQVITVLCYQPKNDAMMQYSLLYPLQLGDVSQAEDALCEANILNNLDPTVWGYLTLVCMKVGTFSVLF